MPLSRPAARFARNQGGEDDIDSLLAAFKLEDDRQATVVVQEDCPSPSPRVYASFLPLPSQASQARAAGPGSLPPGQQQQQQRAGRSPAALTGPSSPPLTPPLAARG